MTETSEPIIQKDLGVTVSSKLGINLECEKGQHNS